MVDPPLRVLFNSSLSFPPRCCGWLPKLHFRSLPRRCGWLSKPDLCFSPRRCGWLQEPGCLSTPPLRACLLSWLSYNSCGRVLNIVSEGDEFCPCRRCGPKKDGELRFVANFVCRRHGECWLPRCTRRCGGRQTPDRPTNESVAARPCVKAYAFVW